MYNSEKYIYETVKSVLNQNYDNKEIIIVDDGSSDDSASIVKEMAEKFGSKIKYYYQENGGVSKARNIGIKKANGKYIAFIDSDDLWLPDKLEKQIAKLKDTKMKSCYCGFLYYYEDSNVEKREKINFAEGKILYDVLSDRTWCSTITWIIEKELIINYKLMFDENCNWGEDFEFFIKIAALTEVACVEEYLSIARVRANSLSTGQAILDKTNDIYVWIRLTEWLEENKNILIYNDMKKVKDLIFGYRIPNSIIKNIYTLVNSREIELNHNMSFIHEKLESKYIKGLKKNNGFKTLKLYIKLFLIKLKLLEHKQ
ncbi:MAG: glycosyl transferase [Clostridiaceae bacterium]|jgi:glycosyltransferase involved in cell wall biosynthesis|nr:glycosyl transferase [Clostridiaceae bacterium]